VYKYNYPPNATELKACFTCEVKQQQMTRHPDNCSSVVQFTEKELSCSADRERKTGDKKNINANNFYRTQMLLCFIFQS